MVCDAAHVARYATPQVAQMTLRLTVGVSENAVASYTRTAGRRGIASGAPELASA